ncbi:hypothetical protein FGO68_gene5576 [Halteria grandinella]|uniref:J domain-containing protein n=1 Tax=Halteria grandinella TaxID=5974 RepID=A0A8J8T1Z3_HALGN|nr:hypothetical protein FGO68_gene5576 [Halteria grandinella]
MEGQDQTPQYTPEQESLCKGLLTKKDYYDILGVAKTASDDEIKVAYRKLALKMHPDRNRAPSATQAFQKVGQAYACLSDAQQRANYDKYGSEEEYRRASQSSASFYRQDFDAQDIFKAFFGNQGNGGDDLNDLLGGIFQMHQQTVRSSGNGVSFSFSFGGGPTGFSYQTSFGGGGRPQRRQQQQQQRPNLDYFQAQRQQAAQQQQRVYQYQDSSEEENTQQKSASAKRSQQQQRAQQKSQAAQQRQQQQQQQRIFDPNDILDEVTRKVKNTCWGLFKIILCLWLFYVYFLSGSSKSQPVKQESQFSLTKTSIFKHDAFSQNFKLPYYLNDVGLKQAETNPSYKKMIDNNLELRTFYETQHQCSQQTQAKNKAINLANSKRDQAEKQRLLQQAEESPMEKCALQAKYEELRSKSE